MRAALYERDNADGVLAAADEKIDSLQAGGSAGLEGTVRLKGHIEHTSPPSDISSIDGNEETERNCHTPNSMSSNENKVNLYIVCIYIYL